MTYLFLNTADILKPTSFFDGQCGLRLRPTIDSCKRAASLKTCDVLRTEPASPVERRRELKQAQQKRPESTKTWPDSKARLLKAQGRANVVVVQPTQMFYSPNLIDL